MLCLQPRSRVLSVDGDGGRCHSSAADKGLPHCLSPGAESGTDGELPGSSVLYGSGLGLHLSVCPPWACVAHARMLLFVVQVQQFQRQRLKNYTETTLGMERPADHVRTGNEFVRKPAVRAENGVPGGLQPAGGDTPRQQRARPGPGASCFERKVLTSQNLY